MLTTLEEKFRTLLLTPPWPQPVQVFLKTRYGLWTIFAVLVLAIFLILNVFLVSGTADVVAAQRGKAVAAVYGTVSVEPSEQVVLKAKSPGTLTDLKVKEGDGVTKGQILATLVDESMVRQLDLATKQLEQAKIKQSLGPASAPELKSKQDEVVRLKRLVDIQNISVAEYDRTVNELASLKTKVRNEEIVLEQSVQDAQLKLKELQQSQADATLIAPIDGKILNIYIDLGQVVEGNTQVIRLGSAANQILASVNEEDVGVLQPDQRAIVRFYSRQGKDVPARLVKVLPKTVNQNYQVIFELEKPMQGLLPGMTGEMNIVTGERKDALLIPTRAIRSSNKVLEVDGRTVRERTVGIGFRGIEKTEILNGLEDGALVIVNDQDKFRPGMRVRAHRVDTK